MRSIAGVSGWLCHFRHFQHCDSRAAKVAKPRSPSTEHLAMMQFMSVSSLPATAAAGSSGVLRPQQLLLLLRVARTAPVATALRCTSVSHNGAVVAQPKPTTPTLMAVSTAATIAHNHHYRSHH